MDIEHALAQHDAATIRAIESGRVDLATRRLRAYVKFAEAFLNATKAHGITFPKEKARSATFLEWPTPSQIVRYAYNGIRAAVKSGNSELIQTGIAIPLHFMRMSVANKDFLFYRRISELYPAILATAYTIDTASGREIAIDKSWQYLCRFAESILPKLIETHDQKIREDYATELIWSLGDLMKIAMDHSDTDNFAAIGKGMNSTFQKVRIRGITEEDEEALEAIVQREKKLVWYGLGAWVVRNRAKEDIKTGQLRPTAEIVNTNQIAIVFDIIASEFSSIKQLENIFEQALAYDYGSSRWEEWSWDKKAGGVQWTTFRPWLVYFYIVMGLRLSKPGNVLAIDIPEPNKNLQFQIKDIRERVEQIRNQSGRWNDLIRPTTERQINGKIRKAPWEYFLKANEIAIKEWARITEDEVLVSPIDKQKVLEVKEQCFKGWELSAWLIKIFKTYRYLDREIDQTEEGYRDIAILEPKEAFIATNDMPYIGIGFNQGMTLGQNLSDQILSQIVENGQSAGEFDEQLFIYEIASIGRHMIEEGAAPVIIARGNSKIEDQLVSASGFSARWNQPQPRFDFNEYLGDMGDIPVIFLFDNNSSQTTIFDISKLGNLTWYTPKIDNFNGLQISIKEIDVTEAKRLIEQQQEFLRNADGESITNEMAIRDLQLHVQLLVAIKIELSINDPAAIKSIRISKNTNSQ